MGVTREEPSAQGSGQPGQDLAYLNPCIQPQPSPLVGKGRKSSGAESRSIYFGIIMKVEENL